MSQLQESGLDINLNDVCSRTAFNWASKSFDHRQGCHGAPSFNFKGSYSSIVHYGEVMLAMSSDGIGTKVELAERTGIYNTIGFDLVAMIVDDLVCNGAEPANLSNILDVDYLDHHIVDQLMEGLYQAAKAANITITGGEIAELGPRVSGYGDRMHFNWCGTGIGSFPGGRLPINGSTVKSGDVVIALKSRGFRSNGFSLARKILNETYGDLWHEQLYVDEQTWGDVLLTPSLIFTPGINALFSACMEITGIAHITGGGIANNLSRMLKANELGARLDNLFDPHPFMKRLQEMGQLETAQAYKLWNMGNGMLVIVDEHHAQESLNILMAQNFEAKIAGKITQSREVFLDTTGEQLVFPAE